MAMPDPAPALTPAVTPGLATVLAFAVSPPAAVSGPGPAPEADPGGQLIPLDCHRRRSSSEAVATSRACHPAQLWADARPAHAEPQAAIPS
jgi:hypothetical protein